MFSCKDLFPNPLWFSDAAALYKSLEKVSIATGERLGTLIQAGVYQLLGSIEYRS